MSHKPQEQLNLDVGNANRDFEAAEQHPFQFLLTRTKMIFDLLFEKYGWTMEDIEHFYPEQTIAAAVQQGWKPPKP